jgi:hypothetical protein
MAPVQFQTIWDGQPTGPAVSRYLDAYDVLVRRNEAVPILDKVQAKAESTLDARVSSGKPFGLARSSREGPMQRGLKKPVKLYGIAESELGRTGRKSRNSELDRRVEGA